MFCERIQKEAEGLENVEIIVRDEGYSISTSVYSILIHVSTAWAEKMGMVLFPSHFTKFASHLRVSVLS